MFAGMLAALLPPDATATVTVVDDVGHRVTLARPARRIVSLAPHATELLFAAGAGKRVVGVSAYSDYPEAAGTLPSIGGAGALDLERIIALRPELIVFWGSGNAPAQVDQLRRLGLPLFESEPRNFEEIATSMERLGLLAGVETQAGAAAQAFRQRWQTLAQRYRARPEVPVFYQVWEQPLMTLNGTHLISSALALCGGRNVFAALPALTPTVGVEDVIKIDPEAIVTAGPATPEAGDASRADAFSRWRRFPAMKAVARNNLFTVNADWVSRAGPRILDGTQALCTALDDARTRRPTR